MPNYDIEATNAKVFSKTGLLSMNGRRNRKPFFFVNYLLVMIDRTLEKFTTYQGIDYTLEPFATYEEIGLLILYIILAYITFTNMAKRFHDLNYSGWLACLSFIPIFWQTDNGLIEILLAILGVYLTFKKGTTGLNFYGPDPLEKSR